MRCRLPRSTRWFGFLLGFASFLGAHAGRADETLLFEGAVPDDGLEHFFVPFEVPAGTQELEVAHDDLSAANILDFGLDDPKGYRGWGGGTSEPVIVNEARRLARLRTGCTPTGDLEGGRG